MPAIVFLLLTVLSSAYALVPVVLLQNAAAENTYMSVTGAGTGGYGSVLGQLPECWGESNNCGSVSYNATLTYIKNSYAAGETNIRIDNADSYDNLKSVGQAIADSGVPRRNIFIVTKTGSPQPLGYQDTVEQLNNVLSTQNLDYVDLALIHWPQNDATSKSSECNPGASLNMTLCRLNTWKAYVEFFTAGKAKAIGVSNFDPSNIQEIIDASMPLPSVNQIPIHIYRSSTQMNTILFCQRHNIVVNAYSPLGVPDWQRFNTSAGMSSTTLIDPVVTTIATKYGKSPAQIQLNWLWQLGIVSNARTLNPEHMTENLNAYTFQLTDGEINLLTSRPQAWCSVQQGDYECAPDS
jgi:diketogulonate reductase-like aldo/keto reductase